MASGAAVFILTPDVWTLALAAGIVLVPLAWRALLRRERPWRWR